MLPKERGQPGLLSSQKLLIIFNSINSSSLIFRQIEGSCFPGAARNPINRDRAATGDGSQWAGARYGGSWVPCPESGQADTIRARRSGRLGRMRFQHDPSSRFFSCSLGGPPVRHPVLSILDAFKQQGIIYKARISLLSPPARGFHRSRPRHGVPVAGALAPARFDFRDPIPSETVCDRPGPRITPDALAKRAGGGIPGFVEKILEFYNSK